MRSTLMNPCYLFLLLIIIISSSIYTDIGNKSWFWFQRSGAVIVLFGAILSYRSIVRLGKSGVGGTPVIFSRARVISIDNSDKVQKIKVAHDPNTVEQFIQHDLDKAAGYAGVWLMAIGTIIWGYGDLIGLLWYK